MTGDLQRLYPALIRSQSEKPYHFEKRDVPPVVKAYNPVCGDRFEIYPQVSGTSIETLHFHGFGCAISKASTSVMVSTLEGRPVEDALRICDMFLRFVRGESSFESLNLPEEFKAFSGVLEFPERYDCATLSWLEMKKFLEVQKQPQ